MRFPNFSTLLRGALCAAWFFALFVGSACPAAAQNTSRVRVRLTAPVSSDGTAGSRVAAQVVSPPNLAGSIIEGRITNAKASGGLNAKSELALKFESLYQEGRQYPIDGLVTGYYNSKGLQNTDDEGHIIKTSNKAVTNAVVGAALGATIGAILSGGKNTSNSAAKNAKTTAKDKNNKNNSSEKNARLSGAATGAAVGAAAGLALGMTADAPRIMFDTGSELELDVKALPPRTQE